MKIRTLLLPIYMGLLSIVPAPTLAVDVFSDSFESADYSTTNTQGFRWTDSAWTSLVTSTHEVWKNNHTISLPITEASSFPGTDWAAKTGSVCMRFRYAAGESWSEQRFDLGTAMKDIWIRYWIRVPTNFTYGPKGNVDKFFAIWSDGYSQHGDGSTVWVSMKRYNTTGASLHYSYSAGGYTSSGSNLESKPFFTVADRGRWMQMVMHFKTESSPGASDGVIETYRRWSNENTFIKFHDIRNAAIKIPTGGPNGFKAGYILGWHQPYTENTEWLMDDFAISDSSPMAGLSSGSPKPPGNLIVQ